MNTNDFIAAIKLVVRDAAIQGTFGLLENPPGRKPNSDLVELTRWFRDLSPLDREHIRKVIRLTADEAIFGILCVLDGVRAIEDTPDKGSLVLTFKKNGCETILNNPATEELHNLFKQEPEK